MSAESLTEEQRAQRLRQRLWGATILIAIAVIVLPLLLDGSGSESQFRRVESLREEPTRIINSDGSRQTVPIPETNAVTVGAEPSAAAESEGFLQRLKRRFTENPPSDTDSRQFSAPEEVQLQPELTAPTQNSVLEDSPAGLIHVTPESEVQPDSAATDHRAWVVQAGSFREEANALAVRDRLRRAGYPSFVSLSHDSEVFRVRVGPMVNKQQAGSVQMRVVQLLGREAIVMPYP